MKSFIPAPEAVARELVLMAVTAIVAALIVQQSPGLKRWLKDRGVSL